ncbi:MAG: hypothetical protein Q4A11_03695 [Brachymonas sp.]|nr:hypothetical protein [Brachymonas sp.]
MASTEPPPRACASTAQTHRFNPAGFLRPLVDAAMRALLAGGGRLDVCSTVQRQGGHRNTVTVVAATARVCGFLEPMP